MDTTKTTIVYLKRDDEVLLAMKKRGFGEGKLNGIGGKVEPGETSEQCAVRETKEEIGVEITEFEKLADINFDEYVKDNHEMVLMDVYIATKWQGEPQESEEMRPQWFKVKDIPYDDMFIDDEHWLPQVLDGQKVRGFFKFDENWQLVDQEVEVVEGL